jgi:hypothetical protein
VEFNIDFLLLAAASQVKDWNSRVEAIVHGCREWVILGERLALIKAFWPPVVTEGIQGSLFNKVRVVDVMI